MTSHPIAIHPLTHRRGTTIAELLVASSLLVTGITLISRGAVQTLRLRQDARHYQLALDEVANQLDPLTAMPTQDRLSALEALQPSEMIQTILPNPKLKAETINDENGERVVIQLEWDRMSTSKPVSLVGWVSNSIASFEIEVRSQ